MLTIFPALIFSPDVDPEYAELTAHIATERLQPNANQDVPMNERLDAIHQDPRGNLHRPLNPLQEWSQILTKVVVPWSWKEMRYFI